MPCFFFFLSFIYFLLFVLGGLILLVVVQGGTVSIEDGNASFSFCPFLLLFFVFPGRKEMYQCLVSFRGTACKC